MAMSATTPSLGADALNRSGALDQRFALDVQGVDALRRTTRTSPQEGLRQVSRQFEALFMNMVLKSMREATPQSGLLDNTNEKLYTSMLDQQLSQNLSGRGLGLAEAMLVQLQRATASATPDAAGDGRAAGMSLAPRPGLPLKPQSGIPLGSSPSQPITAGRADLSAYQLNNDRAASGAMASLQSNVDSFVPTTVLLSGE